MLIGGLKTCCWLLGDISKSKASSAPSLIHEKKIPWVNIYLQHVYTSCWTLSSNWVQIWFKVTRSKSHNRIINTHVTNIWIKYSWCFFVKSTTYITIPAPSWPINFLSPNKLRKTVGIFIVCWNLLIKASSLHTSNPTLGRKLTCDKSLEVVGCGAKKSWVFGWVFFCLLKMCFFLFGLYHGKSPCFHHHLGNFVWNFFPSPYTQI